MNALNSKTERQHQHHVEDRELSRQIFDVENVALKHVHEVLSLCRLDAAAILADPNQLQIVRGHQLRHPIGQSLVHLDLHHRPIGPQHRLAARQLVQPQVIALAGQRGVEGHAQPDVEVHADERLALVAHDAGGAQVVLPQEGVRLLDEGLFDRRMRRDLAIIAQPPRIRIGQDRAALLGHTIHPLLDLHEDRRVVRQRPRRSRSSGCAACAGTSARPPSPSSSAGRPSRNRGSPGCSGPRDGCARREPGTRPAPTSAARPG